MLKIVTILGLAATIGLMATGASFANIGWSLGLRPAYGVGTIWFGSVSGGAAIGGASTPATPEASLPRVPSPAGGEYGLFGSVALPISTLPASAQWKSVSAIDFTTQYGAQCRTSGCATGIAALLAKAARQAEGAPALEALSRVNSAVNTLIRYRADHDDHWATPVETAARGAGDCEDFAIAKLWLLRSIGYSAEQLQMVVLKDRRNGAFHAVLAVHVAGRSYILDNLSDRVLPDSALTAYQPIESFAGDKSFIHGFAGKPVPATALTAEIGPAD